MTYQLHPPTFLATATNSPLINPITSTSYYICQPHHHHTHGTLPLDHLETRVAMMPADKIKCVDQILFETLVTTQPKLIANSRAVKCQSVEVYLTYLVFCNRASRKCARRNLSGLYDSSYSKS